MHLGLIGAGNMANALARGLNEPVLVHDVDRERADSLAAAVGGEAVEGEAELGERGDAVVLCHKPAQLVAVAREVGGRAKAVLTILGGTPLEAVEGAYP